MTSLGEIIEKVIFDIQVENSLKTLTTNYRPNEPYAYLLGCLEMPKAYVYEFIHDAAAESTTSIADPNTDYFIKAYNFKKHMLPETRLDYLS